MPWDNAKYPRAQRLPGDWTKRRAQVLRRDGGLCQIQGPRCVQAATEVDHIRRQPEDHGEHNLQAACKPCHRRKTASESAQASAEARSARAQARFRQPGRHPGLLTDEEANAKRAAAGIPPLNSSVETLDGANGS